MCELSINSIENDNNIRNMNDGTDIFHIEYDELLKEFLKDTRRILSYIIHYFRKRNSFNEENKTIVLEEMVTEQSDLEISNQAVRKVKSRHYDYVSKAAQVSISKIDDLNSIQTSYQLIDVFVAAETIALYEVRDQAVKEFENISNHSNGGSIPKIQENSELDKILHLRVANEDILVDSVQGEASIGCNTLPNKSVNENLMEFCTKNTKTEIAMLELLNHAVRMDIINHNAKVNLLQSILRLFIVAKLASHKVHSTVNHFFNKLINSHEKNDTASNKPVLAFKIFPPKCNQKRTGTTLPCCQLASMKIMILQIYKSNKDINAGGNSLTVLGYSYRGLKFKLCAVTFEELTTISKDVSIQLFIYLLRKANSKNQSLKIEEIVTHQSGYMQFISKDKSKTNYLRMIGKAHYPENSFLICVRECEKLYNVDMAAKMDGFLRKNQSVTKILSCGRNNQTLLGDLKHCKLEYQFDDDDAQKRRWKKIIQHHKLNHDTKPRKHSNDKKKCVNQIKKIEQFTIIIIVNKTVTIRVYGFLTNVARIMKFINQTLYQKTTSNNVQNREVNKVKNRIIY